MPRLQTHVRARKKRSKLRKFCETTGKIKSEGLRAGRCFQPFKVAVFFGELAKSSTKIWSARLDLNQRPHAPQACALPGCATRRHLKNESEIIRLYEIFSDLRKAKVGGESLPKYLSTRQFGFETALMHRESSVVHQGHLPALLFEPQSTEPVGHALLLLLTEGREDEILLLQ